MLTERKGRKEPRWRRCRRNELLEEIGHPDDADTAQGRILRAGLMRFALHRREGHAAAEEEWGHRRRAPAGGRRRRKSKSRGLEEFGPGSTEIVALRLDVIRRYNCGAAYRARGTDASTADGPALRGSAGTRTSARVSAPRHDRRSTLTTGGPSRSPGNRAGRAPTRSTVEDRM